MRANWLIMIQPEAGMCPQPSMLQVLYICQWSLSTNWLQYWVNSNLTSGTSTSSWTLLNRASGTMRLQVLATSWPDKTSRAGVVFFPILDIWSIWKSIPRQHNSSLFNESPRLGLNGNFGRCTTTPECTSGCRRCKRELSPWNIWTHVQSFQIICVKFKLMTRR